MNIVFLDIDGVVCNHRVCWARPRGVLELSSQAWIDPISVAAVNRICADADAKIVVSSTWRNFKDIDVILRTMGILADYHPSYTTTKPGGIRGDQIKAWMDDNGRPSNYVILDDDSDFLKEQLPHLVQTDHEDGILTRHIKRALEIFGLHPCLIR